MRTSAPLAQTWLSRVLSHLPATALAALGALSTAVGAALSLVGLCCTPLVATAATGGAAAGAGVVVAPTTWPFWVSGAVLLTAAALWHRRHRVRAVCQRRSVSSK